MVSAVGLGLLQLGAFLLGAPLLLGVIGRVKAFFGGRTGPPLLQPYRELLRLARKGAVFSRTTTWVFRAGPTVALAAVLAAGLLLPMGAPAATVRFGGDFILFAYLLALARFATVLAALDTGSSFEGMGAAREATFSALAEPALFLGFVSLARSTRSLDLSHMLGAGLAPVWWTDGPALLLVGLAIFAVALAENARVPVDDPATHLELTMIHEVMVLDHSGPDFALIQYGASLKLYLFGALIVRLALGALAVDPWLLFLAFLGGQLVFAILVGAVESTMARLRLVRVPQLLIGASALSAFALVLLLR
jgi:formate hydrogenlyase subunit 4